MLQPARRKFRKEHKGRNRIKLALESLALKLLEEAE
jgi:ribosomal protein L16/L10AE